MLRGAGTVILDELANDPLDVLLLGLFLVQARAHGADVVIAPLPVIERFVRHGGDVFPLLFGQSGEGQFGADVARHDEPLPLRPPDHRVGDILESEIHSGETSRSAGLWNLSIISRRW